MNTLLVQTIPDSILFGRSEAMQEVRRAVERVCATPVPVLLQGERGTGKEVIGQRLHRSSPWRFGPFTKIDAGGTRWAYAQRTMPNAEPLSRLLGVPLPCTGNAFGTLFVDEIGDLAPALQARLLDFFQEGPAAPSKGGAIDPALPRIICSSRRDLERDVIAGRLRPDLFYRINVVTIQLPRLRERKEDIPDLFAHFYETLCAHAGQRCYGIPSELLVALCEYDWPGNIRELENCVAVYVNSRGNVAVTEALLSKRTLAEHNGAEETPKSAVALRTYTRQISAEAEREMIFKVLKETQWNRKDAAKALQISYHTLLQKLRQMSQNRKRKPTGTLSGKEKPVSEERLP